MTPAFVAATLIAIGGLLAAEWRDSSAGRWLSKPLASSGFVATALQCGALANAYGRAVMVALSLCWLGDVLLIPKDTRALRAGISSFLAGHLAFVAAFAVRGVDLGASALAALLLVAPGVFVLRWLAPHLPAPMRPAVVAYVAVISVMLAAAIGTCVAAPSFKIITAALGFAVSDLSVARDRFVRRSFVNPAWGLPLYYVAQLFFATSVEP